jgi:riboflavin kinase
MSETTAAAAVGPAEVAALKNVALDGGVDGPVKVSCSGLASRLDASTQTASRRLQRLESAGLVERDVVSDGQWVELTPDGRSRLREEYEQYRRVFESAGSVELRGTVTSGMGEGRHYISLPGYMEQFRERLGYEPFLGTLNVELDEASVRTRAAMGSLDAVPIDGWEDEERTFGPATCFAATVETGGDPDPDAFTPAHIIVPERTHHDETQLELIAPAKLRDELDLDDGQTVVVRVEDAE